MRLMSRPTSDINHREVFVQDFGDNYHQDPEMVNLQEATGIRKIRRKYRHIAEYLQAMQMYTEYMEVLIERYGGYHIFTLLHDEGAVHEYVPPKPEIKMTRYNRECLEAGIVASPYKPGTADLESIMTWASKDIEDVTNDAARLPSDTTFRAPDHSPETEEVANQLMDSYRTSTSKRLRLDTTKVDMYTYLNNYFQSNRSSRVVEEYKPKLSDLWDGTYVDKKPYDTSEDEEDDNKTVWYQGRFVLKKTQQTMEFFNRLNDYGWDPAKFASNIGMKKSTVKSAKKITKEQKKRMKAGEDSFVSNITGGAFDNFEDFAKDMGVDFGFSF